MDTWNLLERVGHRIEPIAPRLAIRMLLTAALRNSEPELHLVPALADRARLTLDIGANWGLYTARLLPLSWGVVAFEPNPVLVKRLKRAFPDVRVEACALGATPGTAELRIPLMASGVQMTGWATLSDRAFERTESVEVPVRRLDDFGITGVGLIKIDVECFEMQVLQGGIETIRRERPNMMIECGDDDQQPLIDWVAALDYRASFWLDGRLHPMSEWRPDLVTSHGGPPNNLIFQPN